MKKFEQYYLVAFPLFVLGTFAVLAQNEYGFTIKQVASSIVVLSILVHAILIIQNKAQIGMHYKWLSFVEALAAISFFAQMALNLSSMDWIIRVATVLILVNFLVIIISIIPFKKRKYLLDKKFALFRLAIMFLIICLLSITNVWQAIAIQIIVSIVFMGFAIGFRTPVKNFLGRLHQETIALKAILIFASFYGLVSMLQHAELMTNYSNGKAVKLNDRIKANEEGFVEDIHSQDTLVWYAWASYDDMVEKHQKSFE